MRPRLPRPRGAGRLQRPRASLPSVLGRARADAWPLLLVGLVVALTVFVVCAVPRLEERSADDAVREAVENAGTAAGVTLVAPLLEDDWDGRTLIDPARETGELGPQVERFLPPELDEALANPVGTLLSTPFAIASAPAELGSASLRLGYVADPDAPEVEWLEGGPAATTRTPTEVEAAPPTVEWTVEVGLSEEAARLLGVHTGDQVKVGNRKVKLDVLVSGVFRPVDPSADAWSHVPGLVDPAVLGSGEHTRTPVVGLVSAEALPATVLSLPVGTMARTVTFDAVPGAVDHASAELVATQVERLRASAHSLPGPTTAVRSTLDAVLLDTVASVRATRAQASVLLAGAGGVAALTIVLTAHLLARRRAGVLATLRARGASLADVAAEHAIESVTVTLLGAGVGILAADVVVPGAAPWAWLVPALAFAALVGPVLAVRAVAGPAAGRGPRQRHERRRATIDRRVRRAVLEGGVVAAGVGAVVALRARGLTDGSTGTDPLLAAAPTLLALSVALVLVRTLPLVVGVALRRSLRSRHVVPVLAAARARATATQVVPFLALSLACTLAVLGAVLLTTVRDGQVAGSWGAVGGDVRVTSETDTTLDAAATRLGADGTGLTATTGLVIDEVQLSGAWGGLRVRLVAVDADAFARYLAHVPVEGADEPGRLLEETGSDALPVLLSADLAAKGGPDAELLWGRDPFPVVTVGRTPGTEELAERTVVVDRAALAAVTGTDTAPSVLWVAGPGADEAVTAAPELDGAELDSRAEWLTDLRASSSNRHLTVVVVGTITLLAVAAMLVVLFAASAGAPQRGSTLAALRTLGLTGVAARRITLGELAPPVLVASLAAIATGTGLAALVAGPSSLRLITRQAVEPTLAVPWWTGLLPVVLLVTVVLVVAAESSLRRRERLGEVLRAGGQ
ncbi:FtsX-like permease family protein [Sanguibacter sp. 25GB23B1]|uniref:FtsX-like permease family protein n=1 Tax=unclassified Sanguibacter TaxID=2645534 RepID=UPI0032AEFF96